ncbi:hypothetical protein [Nocardiopsis sp. M1B1]|uniref:hypothetical protein n=1 Tax=Nocardiopsis sp. M1B1 TaxID=3450454 RepID=UPI00403A46C9
MDLPFPRVRVPSTPPRTAPVRLLLALPLFLCLGASCLPSADDGTADAPPRSVSDLDAGERERLADALAARSLDTAAEDPRLSSALALEAAGLARTDTSAAAMARLAEPHQIMEFDSGGEGLTSLLFSAHGRFLAGSTERGRVLVWDVYTGDTVFDEQAPGPVQELTLDWRSLLVAARTGDDVIVWDVDSGEEEARIDAAGGRGTAFVSSIRSSLIEAHFLALGSETGEVALWNTQGWEFDAEITVAEEPVSLMASSYSAALATLTDEGTLGLWDVATRQPLGRADLRDSGLTGRDFRFAPSALGPEDIAVASDEGVFIVSSDAVRSGDGPVNMPQYCSGVFCDKPSTRPSAHQRLDTPPGPAAQGNVRFLVTADRESGFEELTLWETPPGTVADYRPVESLPTARAVELVAAASTTTGLHVVAVASSGSGPALWDLSRDPYAPYLDEGSLTIALEARCVGAPVLLGPREWERELPDLAYEPVCVRIRDEQTTDTHGTTTGPTPPTPGPAAPTAD